MRRLHRVAWGAGLAAAALLVAGCGYGGVANSAQHPDTGNGQQLFTANCAACHTLAAAGTTGTIGPNLDTAPSSDAKADKMPLPAFVHQSIVDPNAYIAKGYQPNIMPSTFGSLPKSQLNALVTFRVGGQAK